MNPLWKHLRIRSEYFVFTFPDIYYCNYSRVRKMNPLWKRLRIRSVISLNYYYITVLCPFNLLIRFKCYNSVYNEFKQI